MISFFNFTPSDVQTIHMAISSSIVAGTLWQYSNNVALSITTNFTVAFFFVWFLNGLVFFFMSQTFVRVVNHTLIPHAYRLRIHPPSWSKLWDDFMLALALGAGDAFFVATDLTLSPSNALVGFTIYDGTPVFTAMCKAGGSTMCGFAIGKSQTHACACPEHAF